MADATQRRVHARGSMMAPSVVLLFAWMAIPLAMTLYFSFLHYNLLMPGEHEWAGFSTTVYFLTDPAFATAIVNTLLLVGGVLLITVVGGVLLALLLDQPFYGQGDRAPAGDLAVLRHADGRRAGLEEHDDAPGLRHLRADRARPRA